VEGGGVVKGYGVVFEMVLLWLGCWVFVLCVWLMVICRLSLRNCFNFIISVVMMVRINLLMIFFVMFIFE